MSNNRGIFLDLIWSSDAGILVNALMVLLLAWLPPALLFASRKYTETYLVNFVMKSQRNDWICHWKIVGKFLVFRKKAAKSTKGWKKLKKVLNFLLTQNMEQNPDNDGNNSYYLNWLNVRTQNINPFKDSTICNSTNWTVCINKKSQDSNIEF